MISNTWVLTKAGKQSERSNGRYVDVLCKEGNFLTREWTNVHYLVYHLSIADAIICFIILPMETVWRATMEVGTQSLHSLKSLIIFIAYYQFEL